MPTTYLLYLHGFRSPPPPSRGISFEARKSRLLVEAY